MRQVDDGPRPHGPPPRAGLRLGRLHAFRRRGPRRPLPRRDAVHAGQRDQHDLPGPDDVAQPDEDDRVPGGRADADPPQRQQGRGARARRGGARPRRPAPPEGAPRRLSPPALGRHAPARHDRDGARVRPEAPHRRRADDGTRRHDPGADPRAARRPARPARDGGPAHHPRHGSHRQPDRPRRRDVRRPGGRVDHHSGAVRDDAPPVLAGAPRLDPPSRLRPAPAAAQHPGAAARPHRAAEGLPLRPPLHQRHPGLPRAGPAARRRRRRSPLRLLAPRRRAAPPARRLRPASGRPSGALPMRAAPASCASSTSCGSSRSATPASSAAPDGGR